MEQEAQDSSMAIVWQNQEQDLEYQFNLLAVEGKAWNLLSRELIKERQDLYDSLKKDVGELENKAGAKEELELARKKLRATGRALNRINSIRDSQGERSYDILL